LSATAPEPAPTDRPPLRVLAFAGSLRRESYNRRLARAAAERAPAGLEVALWDDLAAIPLFSEDLEAAGVPEPVAGLRRAVAAADGVLIATPEYNQSIPGVLKNAVDWLSRRPERVLRGKPVAIVGATPGLWGTRFAQAELRHVLTATESLVLPVPAVFLRDAAAVFDGEGRLTDERTLESLGRLLAAFGEWIELHRR
jgi:chromate reductase